MVTAGKKVHTTFPRIVGLGLRDLTCQKSVYASGNSTFKIALRPSRAPAQGSNLSVGRSHMNRGFVQGSLHMLGQGLRAGKHRTIGALAHKAQLLLAESSRYRQPQSLAQLSVVAQLGVGI